MKNIDSLLKDHQESMTSFYSDFMDHMKEYVDKSISSYMDSAPEEEDDEELPERLRKLPAKAKQLALKKYSYDEEEESEDDEFSLYLAEQENIPVSEPAERQDPAAYSEGYMFDELGDPILDSYDESDIDADNPAFYSGKSLGIPKTLVLNFNPRGDFDSLIPYSEEEE